MRTVRLPPLSALHVVALCCALSACVTINVYFPAAAAEEAADRIIKDVWGTEQTEGGSASPRDDKRGALEQVDRPIGHGAVMLAALGSALEMLIPSAHAQADLNVSTPAIRQLTQSMEQRHAQLKPWYDSGAIGLTRDGLVQVRDQNLVPLQERNRVRKLVADENADRANLYREIAAANGHPEWEADIRATFAERWVSNAPAGWYYQDDKGAWSQKGK